MLQDVRSSHRVREEQLASAARSYKKRLQKITKTHHALFIAYSIQRERIMLKPESGLDPGPPESHFSLGPAELRDETEKELQQLSSCFEAAADMRGILVRCTETAEADYRLHISKHKPSHPSQFILSNYNHPRKIKNTYFMITMALGFPLLIQVSLEKERALLITRAAAAEAQVSELQDYINKQLCRSGLKEAIERKREGEGEKVLCKGDLRG
uniref:Coiled-coil domain containing 78 n=1 Tax=Labrus bergylta TaxID=56723 RepID=A0A3Q3FGV0_9LABR